MKAPHYLALFLAAACLFTACQKELSPPSTAAGHLVKTAAGDCAQITVGGVYLPGTALTAANTIAVQVNFTNTGSYAISSDTVNGYSFKAAGQATATGTTTVTLTGSGSPAVPGTNPFTIRFGTSSCIAAVVVNTAAAAYSFGNTAGVCTGIALAGSYTTGVPLSPANTATVTVTVTTPGAYSITSSTVNGMTFTKSGVFTTNGSQPVVLTGSGTPAAAGSFTFMTAATGGCNFIVPVVSPVGALAQLSPLSVTGITCVGATLAGDVTATGGSAVTARGFCYGTTLDPTIAQTVVNCGSGTGSFQAILSGLSAGALYHVRGFATNSAGTAYSADLSFNALTGCTQTTYVAGRDDFHQLAGNTPYPKQWIKTGGSFVGTQLPIAAGSSGTALSIYVSGTDVYTAGEQNGKATIWKNGLATELGDGAATAVSVSGTDVYVAGNGLPATAMTWKNGVGTVLPNGGYISDAFSIFVSGNDVYIAGRDYQQLNGEWKPVATVWKNGVAMPLTTAATSSEARSVFVVGSDVYVAGKENETAKLWKNGVVTVLPVSGADEGVANSVFVSGGDVYVAGQEHDGNSINSYGILWKNGVKTALTVSGYQHTCNSVFVYGADVFVCGNVESFSGNGIATVWRNGFATPLTAGSTEANAKCIFVK